MVTHILYGFTILFLFAYLAYKEVCTQAIIKDLTNKLISRDAQEYKQISPEIIPRKKTSDENKVKKPVDPVLGEIY